MLSFSPVRNPFVVAFGCLLLATAGCATPATKTFDGGQSVAFGRVEVISDGKPIDNLQGMSGDVTGAGLVILRPGRSEAEYIPLAGSGEFFWQVGPGEYTVMSFQFLGGGSRKNLEVGAKFTVPAEPSSVYVGNLVVLLRGAQYSVGTIDRYEALAARLDVEQPGHPPLGEPDIMAFQPPLGRFTQVIGPCAERWQVTCEDYHFGVTPVSPKHQRGKDTMVSSLTPTFQWQGSPRPDVHYDLVVRRSLTCSGAVLFSEALPGDVVLYKEDIAETSYTPEEPLPAGTSYIWSVRFREGDVVSAWSSTGHFTFFIIGFSSSHGDWFRFCTPEVK
jgi:hypothetical protein